MARTVGPTVEIDITGDRSRIVNVDEAITQSDDYEYNFGGTCLAPRGDYSIDVWTGSEVTLMLPTSSEHRWIKLRDSVLRDLHHFAALHGRLVGHDSCDRHV